MIAKFSNYGSQEPFNSENIVNNMVSTFIKRITQIQKQNSWSASRYEVYVNALQSSRLTMCVLNNWGFIGDLTC